MTPTVKAAAPDAATFAAQGLIGLLFYAMLLIIFWLLVRDFLKDRLIWKMVQAAKEADKVQADALRSIDVQLSRLESALGVERVRRDRETGALPRGLIE